MMQQTKRIPNGKIYDEIPLEAAKSYAIKIWEGTGIWPRIAYADHNTHPDENPTITVKLLPDGGKTAPHPQIVFFAKSKYHTEEISRNPDYRHSNPFEWTTMFEAHLDGRILRRFHEAVVRAECGLEAL